VYSIITDINVIDFARITNLFRIPDGVLTNEHGGFKLNASHPNASRHFVNRNQVMPPQYMCGECGKGYKWMDNLRRHQRLECGKLPKWHCEICMKMFYRRYELTKHLNLKHNTA